MVKCTRAIILTLLLIVQSRAFSPADKRLPRSPSSATASPATLPRITKAGAPIVLSNILYRFPAYADIGGSLASPAVGEKLDGSGMSLAESAFQWFFLLYVFGSLAVGAKEMLLRANNQLNKDN
mmetsp:Transcript_32662/g.77979  ORF Transcript_32662/g.77979 Transcript_32662/m.77979 type:complete len:124 (-) Transcript_32662:1386-1757(-)